MASAFFSFEPYDCGRVHDVQAPLKNCETNGGLTKGEETQLFGSEDWGDLDYICSQYASYEDSIPRKEVILSDEEDQQQPFSDFGMLDDFQFIIDSPPFQAPDESVTLDSVLTELSDFVEPKNERQYPTTLGSLELLNEYKSGYNKMNVGRINENHHEPCKVVDDQRLSTEEVMRVAGAQYIQFSVRNDDHLSMLSHPFSCAFSGLGREETNDVELASLLLASAEKIGNQQYDRASKLLTQCAYLSSSTGNPVQRVSFYFAEALQERLNRETGRISFKGGKKGRQRMEFGVAIDFEEGQMTPSSAHLECHQKIPFCQVLQFPGVQAIVESVALARKVHLVDLGIQAGIAWTVLMQALAARHECPVELFKLTGIGTDEQEIQDTGKRLANFAESMGLPFSFKAIIVSNMDDLKEELFDVTEDEAIAVYSPFVLRTMLTRSERLDSLMRVIRNLNPCLMVVTEIEGCHNSPSFFNRFIECLFFYSAFFDCLEACMDRNNQNRITTERHYFGQGIMNIVATEGEERTFRHVGINVWRAFFARFGMVEIEFSHSSLYQANLIRKQFACGSLCTLDMNKKCLTVGWKGTPLHSLSVWKFH
ncbi:hypothetical protein AQUCO_01800004v1 [Aquilegia coerulea]|uniref:Uncharacterized protein n=1 Tax=Aquilegia coerulea TaxID=218851 RepID=A0A2G5DJE8_AQUCA|nr:hypothetical protein AQUCO_01800004v1 [Aquilegia coerulea]